jgi:16S rRNA (cytosine1402-N4)-methyltransferase
MEHYPVLCREALEYLGVRPDGIYIDTTAGLGGHSGAIARNLTTGRVIALDRDAESLELARANTADLHDRITFRQSRFSQLVATLAELGIASVNGILSDLGVSRMQLVTPDRGFSLQQAGPLDMRMDRSQALSAADLINRSSEQELADMIFHLGEERRQPRKLARALVRARPIRDTRHLAEVIASVVPRTGKLHPATRVFQALRMAVNDEPSELEALLQQAPDCLAPEGRFVVIAFHSGDDRKVKHAFQALARDGRARVLTKHVVKPGPQEVRENPPSRSAVLRAVERTLRPEERKKNI